MDKKLTNICLFIIMGMIIYVVIFGNSNYRNTYNRIEDKSAITWNDHLEKTKEDDNSNRYYFKGILPKEDIAGKVIAYDTAHMSLNVRINGELVYSLMPKENSLIKTTGYAWNFIILDAKDAGKEIEFEVTPVYADCRPKGEFYYGSRNSVVLLIIKERIMRFSVAYIILLAGILLAMYYWLIIKKENRADQSIQIFSIFAIMLGIWSLCESQLLELFLSKGILIVYLDHLMLMCMPTVFLVFLRQMYQNKDHILWKICGLFNIVLICTRVFLQLIHAYDLRETLWMTHICLAIFIVCVVILSIYEIRISKISKELRVNIVCVLVIMLATLMELFVYRVSNKSASLGSMGFMFYIVVMSIASIRKSRMKMERAKESEIYRKLAFTDELTGVYNRMAFNRDKETRIVINQKEQQSQILPTVIYMFDLNDLKKCNDNFGHEYGDQYITMVSEVLKNIFGVDGNCYRIGGDEFCVMMPYGTEQEIQDKVARFRNLIHEKDKEGFVVPVSVAVGYGIFDPSIDRTLDDTMRRADEIMYQDKQKIKAARLKTNN